MSNSYIALGYTSADEYYTLREYYQNIIGEYVKEQCTYRGFVGELLGICLGHDHHETARLTRELLIDVMALLSDPEVSIRLENHLRPYAGRLLKTMVEIFEEVRQQDISLDLIAVDHDCPKSFFNDLDEKYGRLYEEAGMSLPDLPVIAAQLHRAS